jgi:hypothetical protein
MLRNTNKLSGVVVGERLLFSLNLVRPRIYILFIRKITIVFFFSFQHEANFSCKPFRFKGGVPRATTFSKTKPFIWLWTSPMINSHGSGITLLRAQWWKPLPTPARFRGNVFMPVHLRHDIRNLKVEVVSLLPHREGEAMAHVCCREYEWGLGWT